METSPSQLSSYPNGGSYGSLLNWHIGWGTRPHCSKDRINTPWKPSAFYRALFRIKDTGGKLEDRSKRKLIYWRQPDGPPPQDEDTARRIEFLLFDDDPNLRAWRDDLRRAWRDRYDRDYFVDEPAASGAPIPSITQPAGTGGDQIGPDAGGVQASSDAVRVAVSQAAAPATSSLEFHREQAERLKVERRANARRSAMLLAVEAERFNAVGNYNAGMRFALAGWLETTKENIECLTEVKAQLERGARGLRFLFCRDGFRPHAFCRNSLGGSGLIVSDDRFICWYDLITDEIITLCGMEGWLVISLDQLTMKASTKDGNIVTVTLSDAIGPGIAIEPIWPIREGGVIYHLNWRDSGSITMYTPGIGLLEPPVQNLVDAKIIDAAKTTIGLHDRDFQDMQALASPDGSIITLFHSDQLHIYDTKAGCVHNIRPASGSTIAGVAFSKSSDLLFVTDSSGLSAYNATCNFDRVYRWPAGYDYISDISFSDSGNIVTAEWSGNYREPSGYFAFYASTGKVILSALDVAAIAVCPADRLIAIIHWDWKLVVYNNIGEHLGTIDLPAGCDALKFSNDGKLIFAFSTMSSNWFYGKTTDCPPHINMVDVDFEWSPSIDRLVEFVCDVKLKGREILETDDWNKACYREIPYDVVDQCRSLLIARSRSS